MCIRDSIKLIQLYNSLTLFIYVCPARTPKEKIEKLKTHFTVLALIRSTTDNIIARYVMSYTYSDRFEKELARVKKMAEILDVYKRQNQHTSFSLGCDHQEHTQ